MQSLSSFNKANWVEKNTTISSRCLVYKSHNLIQTPDIFITLFFLLLVDAAAASPAPPFSPVTSLDSPASAYPCPSATAIVCCRSVAGATLYVSYMYAKIFVSLRI